MIHRVGRVTGNLHSSTFKAFGTLKIARDSFILYFLKIMSKLIYSGHYVESNSLFYTSPYVYTASEYKIIEIKIKLNFRKMQSTL